ncbi:RNA 2',3'-cyclic phosphodiesterase [Mangrovibacterium sp.]|uniref:RNA 2',3'-cyclic phosphodiesterase n=1 Tax=Mangrovibacterium sp. TaxID=1961364 RepID=UPI0035628210
MKRIFVAIPVKLEPQLLDLIERLKTQLKEEEIRWVSPKNYHLTLHFFGNVNLGNEEVIGRLLEEAISGQRSFQFQLNGLRFFNKGEHPQVLFIDVAECAELNELAAKMKELLKKNGFPIATQKFRPHLTIARMKSVKDLERLSIILNQSSEGLRQIVNVRELTLYESELHPTGAVYKPLNEFILEG